MKILVVGKFYTEGFALHIAETLSDMGHQVSRFEPGAKYQTQNNWLNNYLFKFSRAFFEIYSQTSTYIKTETKKLLKAIEENQPSLIFCCHDFLNPFQIKTIRQKYDSKIILWYPDHIGLFKKGMFLASDYNHIYFKDPYIVRMLKAEYGLEHISYLPECCNPKYHKPVSLSKKDIEMYACEITTAGNMHSSRAALFRILSNYDCKIWGNPAPLWLDTTSIKNMIQNKFVANEEKSKAFSAAKIVINSLQPGEIESINVRTFEIAAAAGFQLIPYRPAVESLFVIGEEIITYSNVIELKELIDYYIHENEIRLRIARKASERALKEHTYRDRLSLILEDAHAVSL